MSWEELTAGAGGGGLLGTILVWLGFRGRIDRLEERFDDHKKNVVYKETFKYTIEPMQKDIGEIKTDIKQLLINSTKRRNSDNH